MGFWGSVTKGLGQLVGTKPGIWYQKKKKTTAAKPNKTRLNVGGATTEEEIAEEERKMLAGLGRSQGKRKVDFKGGGLLGGGSGLG